LVSASAIYYTTRIVMFVLSFVLEDWAIHELVHSPRRRSEAVTLVASSYVTWTFQTHTFSNSVETILVLWCLVLMQRIAYTSPPEPDEKGRTPQPIWRRSYITSSLLLGFLLVFGLFNRITFPAFLLIPGIQLLPHLWNRCARLALRENLANSMQTFGVSRSCDFSVFLDFYGDSNRHGLLYRPSINNLFSSTFQTSTHDSYYNPNQQRFVQHESFQSQSTRAPSALPASPHQFTTTSRAGPLPAFPFSAKSLRFQH